MVDNLANKYWRAYANSIPWPNRAQRHSATTLKNGSEQRRKICRDLDKTITAVPTYGKLINTRVTSKMNHEKNVIFLNYL